MRTPLAGLLVVAAYVVTARLSLGPNRPLRPFFEGSGTLTPFQWVNPPEEFKLLNQTPQPESLTLPVIKKKTKQGRVDRLTDAGNLVTPDGQAALSVPSGVFVIDDRTESVTITLSPLDPATLGPPPEGLEYVGNAVEVAATLDPPTGPATLIEQDCEQGGCLQFSLRYPFAGTQLWHLDAGQWSEVTAENFTQSSSMFGKIEELGAYAVTSIPGHGSDSGLAKILAFVFGGLAVVGSVVLQRVRSRRRKLPPSGRSGGKSGRQLKAQGNKGKGSSGQRRNGSSKGATRGKPRR